MKHSRRGIASRPMLLLLLFLSLMLLVNHAAAQETDAPEPTDADDTATEEETPPPTETDAETDAETTEEPETTPPPETTEPATTEEPTTEEPTTTEDTETDEPTTTESPTETDTEDSTMPTLPSLTDGVSIPTPAVPPKEGAPYLEQSNLPEGTVFIGVGAALGLIALVVIAWRVLVAWSINRSVRQSATNHHQTDATALLPASKNRKSGKGKVHKEARGSSMTMEKLGNSSRHSGLPPRNSHNPSSGLFFSPTAGASMHTSGNRGSGYLPAGYYASSNASAGGGVGQAQQNGPPAGLSPLGQQSQRYSRATSLAPSPPGSPGLRPSSRDDSQGYPSSSNVNLTSAPQGRAPSAYLEDLFENHPPGR